MAGQGTPGSDDQGIVQIVGSRVLLRALSPDEVDSEWEAMVTADPMTIVAVPDEAEFRSRLSRSGHMCDGWLDLAIDVSGHCIGRIQTFVPPGRPIPPGTYEVGIGLRSAERGHGYGTEALRLFTDWLFERASADVVEAPTDPANLPMQTVFGRAGWSFVHEFQQFGRTWRMFRITRQDWLAQRRTAGCPCGGADQSI